MISLFFPHSFSLLKSYCSLLQFRHKTIVALLGTFSLLFPPLTYAAPDNQVSTEDWSQATGLGWPNGSALTHTFTNLNGSGVDMTMTFSADDWDNDIAGNDDAPNIYTTNGALSSGADYEPAPNAAYEGALRWTTNWFDNNGVGVAGAADGPRLVTLTFSQPVYVDDFEIGSISTNINNSGSDEQFQVIANVQGGGTALPDATGRGNLGSAGTDPSLGPVIDMVNGATYIRGTQSQMTGNYGHAELSYTSQPITSMTVAFYCAQSPVNSVPTGDSNDCQGSATINLLTVSSVPTTAFCPDNLLLNGSFESPGSNTQDLDIWLDTVEATNSAGLTPKPDGLFYAVQNAGQPFIQDVAITGTNTYTLTFHAGSHDPATENNVVHLQYLDASDTLISEVTHTISHDVDAAAPPETLSPQRTLSLGTSPANAAKVRVSVETLAGFSKIDAMCLLATTSVPSQTELSINKTVNVTSATSGQTIVYTISVDNSSSVDATGVVLVDPLPSTVTYVSDDGGATTSESNGTVTWNLGNVNANSSASLNITVIVN